MEAITQEVANFRLSSDENNWIIQRKRRQRLASDPKGQPGTGEAYWVDDKYYPRLDQAALALLELVGRDHVTSKEIAKLIVVSRKARQYVIDELHRITGGE